MFTLIATFVFLVIVVAILVRVGSPVYRIDEHNVIALLELVVNEQGSEQDWDVFMAFPIRHNDELYRIQQRCSEIEQEHYIGGREMFSRAGRQLLAEILEDLKRETGNLNE